MEKIGLIISEVKILLLFLFGYGIIKRKPLK